MTLMDLRNVDAKKGGAQWMCELQNEDVTLSGRVFVPLPDLNETFFAEHNVTSGETTLVANGATIDGEGLHIPSESCPILGEVPPGSRRRRLASNTVVTGTKSVLVIRVRSTSDAAETSSSADTLYQRVFADAVNLKSQTLACSHGKLNFVPASGHPTITNGVTTVQMAARVIGRNFNQVEDDVIAAATAQLGGGALNSKFNHVMICMPPGTVDSFGDGDWCVGIVWSNGYTCRMFRANYFLCLPHPCIFMMLCVCGIAPLPQKWF